MENRRWKIEITTSGEQVIDKKTPFYIFDKIGYERSKSRAKSGKGLKLSKPLKSKLFLKKKSMSENNLNSFTSELDKSLTECIQKGEEFESVYEKLKLENILKKQSISNRETATSFK